MGHGGVQACAAPAHPQAPAAFLVLSLCSVHLSWMSARCSAASFCPGGAHTHAPGVRDGTTPMSLSVWLKHINSPILLIPVSQQTPWGLRDRGFGAGMEPGCGPAAPCTHPAFTAAFKQLLHSSCSYCWV